MEVVSGSGGKLRCSESPTVQNHSHLLHVSDGEDEGE